MGSWKDEELCDNVGQRIMERCGTEDHGKMWDRGSWEDVGQRIMGRMGVSDKELGNIEWYGEVVAKESWEGYAIELT